MFPFSCFSVWARHFFLMGIIFLVFVFVNCICSFLFEVNLISLVIRYFFKINFNFCINYFYIWFGIIIWATCFFFFFQKDSNCINLSYFGLCTWLYSLWWLFFLEQVVFLLTIYKWKIFFFFRKRLIYPRVHAHTRTFRNYLTPVYMRD